MKLNTIEELIEDIRQGKMVILMDDEDRENEGDLIIAASMVRPADINFMATHARGLICLTLTQERCEQLNLPLMVDANQCQHGTNFTMSIEAAEGVTTGISAADRAKTILAAVARDAEPRDIVQPGHIFPLKAQAGGVLRRAGHTEAGCDLARLAGLEAAAAIVEIMNEDGTMARRPDLEVFAEQHDLKIGTIADLIHYRTFNEKTIEKMREETMPTEYGDFQMHVFQDLIENQTHIALVKGDLANCDAPFARVHIADPLRDLVGAIKNEGSGWSLSRTMKFVSSQADAGVIVLLGDSFQDHCVGDLVESFYNGTKPNRQVTEDGKGVYRNIGTGAQILRQLGIGKMRLLSAPMRFNALSGFDLEVTEYISSSEE
ncbi:3,4-dihydroxy-2-butanone-4-phosphate synthase [Gammaproteobacteria bacterium 45_16_T64]|nr:3,4-dihydroxy-2-butanone-4-phosphate synthase [Gammaproteobacteria bacterium 45_16_T64]